jgi:hypothetical protein
MLRTFSKNIAVVLMSFHHWKNEAVRRFVCLSWLTPPAVAYSKELAAGWARVGL